MIPPESRSSRGGSLWRPAALLAGLLCCVYLLSYAGSFRVDDEHILAARAQSLALRGGFEDPQVYGNSRVRALAPFGDPATQIEPLQTILASALYTAGIAAGVGGAQAMLTLNLYLTALTGGLVFLTVIVLGLDRRVAVWCGLLFGLATMAWPYASTFLRDTLAMTLASVAFLGWGLILRDERRWRLLGLAAVLIGVVGGILSKNTAWSVPLALAIAGSLRWLGSRGTPRRLAGVPLALVLAGTGLLLVVFLLPGGGPLARLSGSYYLFLASHFRGSLTPSLLLQMAGPFLSPAKSIFLFAPALLLSIPGAFLGWKTGRHFILPAWLTALLLALGQALFYRDGWAGTFGWGLRAMLPALPPLMVVAAWTVHYLLAGPVVRKVGLWAVAAFGFLVQLAGSWVSWNRIYSLWTARGLDPFAPAAAWKPVFLAIGPQFAMLFDSSAWSMAWWRLWRTDPASVSPILVGGVLLLVLLGWRLRKELGVPGAGANAWAAVLLAVVLVFPLWPSLRAYRTDSAFGGDRPEARVVIDRLREEAKAGDVVVVDPYASPLWQAMVNTWRSPVRWYSLPIELPAPLAGESSSETPSPEVVAVLQENLRSSTTVWYASLGEVPSESLQAKLRWLDQQADLVEEVEVEGAPQAVLRGYSAR